MNWPPVSGTNWTKRTELKRLLSQLSRAPMPEWFAQDGALLLFARLRLHANLEAHPFPARMSEKGRLDLRDRLEQIIWNGQLPSLQDDLYDLDPLHWEFSSERWLQEPLHLSHAEARYYLDEGESRDWLLMGEDHLRLSLRGSMRALQDDLPKAEDLLALLDSQEGLALGDDGSRLCAHPFLCGVGAQLTLVLHLPALCWWGRIEEVLDPFYKLGFCYRTWQEGYGDFLLIENVDGESHPDTASLLQSAASLLPIIQQEEDECREKLATHRRTELEDRIHRALAVCRHARQIGYPELVEHASMLRLAAQLEGAEGWTLPAIQFPVSSLLMKLAPAHLAMREGSADGRQSAAQRARLLRSEWPAESV